MKLVFLLLPYMAFSKRPNIDLYAQNHDLEHGYATTDEYMFAANAFERKLSEYVNVYLGEVDRPIQQDRNIFKLLPWVELMYNTRNQEYHTHLSVSGKEMLGFAYRLTVTDPESPEIMAAHICEPAFTYLRIPTELCKTYKRLHASATEMVLVANEHRESELAQWDSAYTDLFVEFEETAANSDRQEKFNSIMDKEWAFIKRRTPLATRTRNARSSRSISDMEAARQATKDVLPIMKTSKLMHEISSTIRNDLYTHWYNSAHHKWMALYPVDFFLTAVLLDNNFII